MQVTTFAVDLAKAKFQVHGYTALGERVVQRTLKRDKLLDFFAGRDERCRVVMEACGTAHYWARELIRLGFAPELIPAQFTKAFLIGNKHDRNDTDAIFEAGQRQGIRRVAVKSEEQLAIQAVHRVRERIKRERTAVMNQARGLLAEHGYVFGKQARALRRGLRDVLEAGRLPGLLLELIAELDEEWRALDGRLQTQDRRLKRLYEASEACQRIGKIAGVGEVTATAMVGCVGDVHAFRSGRQFSASLGLTPGEHSSGEVHRLGRITKRGDRYLRTLLIHGGRAAVKAARHKSDPRSQWINALVARAGRNKAAVAVANKNARIIWALLTGGDEYRPALAA